VACHRRHYSNGARSCHGPDSRRIPAEPRLDGFRQATLQTLLQGFTGTVQCPGAPWAADTTHGKIGYTPNDVSACRPSSISRLTGRHGFSPSGAGGGGGVKRRRAWLVITTF